MITLYDIVPVLVLGGVAWFWMDTLKAREVALHAARAACTRIGLQLLDETVAAERTRLARNDNGQICLRRVYRFEFSDTGDNRRKGSVVMLGRHVDLVQMAGVLEAVK